MVCKYGPKLACCNFMAPVIKYVNSKLLSLYMYTITPISYSRKNLFLRCEMVLIKTTSDVQVPYSADHFSTSKSKNMIPIL